MSETPIVKDEFACEIMGPRVKNWWLTPVQVTIKVGGLVVYDQTKRCSATGQARIEHYLSLAMSPPDKRNPRQKRKPAPDDYESPPKPRRKRRTKAEIEAARQAGEKSPPAEADAGVAGVGE